MKTPLLLLAALAVWSVACAPPAARMADADPMNAAPTAEVPDTPSQSTTLVLQAMAEHPLVKTGSGDDLHVLLKTTAIRDTSRTDRLPLNLAVVIDKSGSMEAAGKLEYVKDAFDKLVENLDAEDRLTIVAYDSDVRVLRGSDAAVLDKAEAKKLVRQLHPGSGTNLSGGMLQGYAEALKMKRDGYVNRVLLLSDGLANEGITSPVELRRIVSNKFEKDGIALSTFGVGAEFNEDLMTALAETGQGNYWYIDSPDRTAAIFQEEMNGLLAVVAQNVVLTLDYPRELVEVKKVWGAEPTIQEGRITLRLNDAYSGEERNVVVTFRPREGVHSPVKLAARVEYDDVLNTSTHTAQDALLAIEASSDDQAIAEARNEEVTRRQVQYQANWNLEQAMMEADKGNYEVAQGLASANALYFSSSMADVATDSSIIVLYDLNNSYATELKSMEERSEGEKKLIQKDSKNKAYRNKKGK